MKKVLDTLEGWDASHVLALINAVGGRDIAAGIASGKKRVTVKDAIRILFSHMGHGIPLPGMSGFVDADRSFYLTQPKINYAVILARLQQFYGPDAQFMTASEFQARCEAAIERVKNDPQVANLLASPHFPFALPQLAGDIGTLLDDTIIPALDRSYCARFPERSFTNYRRGELAEQVTVIHGTRQERLIRAMAEGPVCGVYFSALQGFGIAADREFIGHLPEFLILAGLEVPIVATAYPEIVARDYYTPGLDMASLQWQSSSFSLGFEASDDGVYFSNRRLNACDYYSGGVSVLG